MFVSVVAWKSRLWLRPDPQTLVERGMHRVVGTADDEVNDLDGREDDVQTLAYTREGLREEAVVERIVSCLPVRACTASIRSTIAW